MLGLSVGLLKGVLYWGGISVGIILLLFFVAWMVAKKKVLAIAVKVGTGIASKILGVKVTIQEVNVVFGGTGSLGFAWGKDDEGKFKMAPMLLFTIGARVSHMVVGNPEGYKSECLMHLEEVTVEVDVMSIILSLTKRIVVHKVELSKLLVVYEKDGVMTNNADTMIKNLKKKGEKKDEEAKAKAKPKVDPKAKTNGKGQPEEPESTNPIVRFLNRLKKGREIIIKQVHITGIQCELATSFGEDKGAPGMVMACGDIKHQHFTNEVLGKGCRVDKIFAMLLQGILYSVLQNLTNVGEFGKNALKGAAGSASRMASGAAGKVGDTAVGKGIGAVGGKMGAGVGAVGGGLMNVGDGIKQRTIGGKDTTQKDESKSQRSCCGMRS